ncbi:hypothetical protein VRB30_13510 [Pseudomonas poae]|uniref:hypothetical protein n=1 Tax=Pseudomonas poae TaxID=200451 RepID=UPI0030E26866
MSAVFNFERTPLSIALTAPAIALLLMAAPNARAQVAVTLPGTSISSGTRLDSYVLSPGSSLTAHGAATNQIVMNAAGLIVEAGSTTQDITANLQSTVLIDGSQVTGRPLSSQAIMVNSNSSLLVTNNSTVTNYSGWGCLPTEPQAEQMVHR